MGKRLLALLCLWALCLRSFSSPAICEPSLADCRVTIESLTERLRLAVNELSILKAKSAVGLDEGDVLTLLGELRRWRLGLLPGHQGGGIVSGTLNAPVVVDVIEDERVLLLSNGGTGGITVGSLLKIGQGGVVAKVVESREFVSAAIVQRPFDGTMSELTGCLAVLFTR